MMGLVVNYTVCCVDDAIQDEPGVWQLCILSVQDVRGESDLIHYMSYWLSPVTLMDTHSAKHHHSSSTGCTSCMKGIWK